MIRKENSFNHRVEKRIFSRQNVKGILIHNGQLYFLDSQIAVFLLSLKMCAFIKVGTVQVHNFVCLSVGAFHLDDLFGASGMSKHLHFKKKKNLVFETITCTSTNPERPISSSTYKSLI